jgi:hypothetical protein
MSTLDLSNVLIDRVVDYIAPETHLSFALACKRHSQCSQKMLAHHRECSVKHREITDVFHDFSRPEDPVAAYHNRDFVAHHGCSIVRAFHIPTLRSLEIRRFDGGNGRGEFNPSILPESFKPSITELCFRNVWTVSEQQLDGLIQSLKKLKVIKVEHCSFDKTDELILIAARQHPNSIEVIHFGGDQDEYGDENYHFYTVRSLDRGIWYTSATSLSVLAISTSKATMDDASLSVMTASITMSTPAWPPSPFPHWISSRSVSHGLVALSLQLRG